MAMGAAIAGIAASAVSAGTSIYGAVSASDSAGSAASSASDSTSVLSDIAKSQWDRYLATFAPMENELVAEVQQPARQNAGFLAEMGSINRQYGNSGSNIRAMMGGKNPYGSGLSYGYQRSNELNRTKTLAGAESTYNQNRLNNMMRVASLGQGLVNAAGSNAGNAANSYANLAKMYSNQASSAGESAGSSFGNLLDMASLLKGTSGGSVTSIYDPNIGETMYTQGGTSWFV